MAIDFGKIMAKVFGSRNERLVKGFAQIVADINAREETYQQMTDAELHQTTERLRERLSNGETADQILPDAFAAVREVSDRQLGIRNVFLDEFEFDATKLATHDAQETYRRLKSQLDESTSIHQLEVPVSFNEVIRKLYPDSRPPFRFRHFDVQCIGGQVLYNGKIAEMATGEGKTLVATLASYLTALGGQKVHIVTVNDYLAQRDRDWMAPVFEGLGITVGAIQSSMDSMMGEERRAAYGCDITYGTNNEFGFDYLRDNMKARAVDQCLGRLDYAIVDEVDSILIDEARTPLIISGPANDDTERYRKADVVARKLIQLHQPYTVVEKKVDACKRNLAAVKGEKDRAAAERAEEELAEAEAQLAGKKQYYEVEYDRHQAHLTEVGVQAAQDEAGVGSFYVGDNMDWPHLMENSLRGHLLYVKDKEYVVQNNEVVIVDEFTGRLMHGRQWSDGLHQAVEAKERVTIKKESQTLATITFQNFFKLYDRVSGMTGTAMTESDEFSKIYALEVVAIPTNRTCVRNDQNDLVYKTVEEKFTAIVDEIHEVHQRGQPVLVGTISVEKSEAIANALTKRYGLEHEVLNAKNHAREASIIAKAGFQTEGKDGKRRGNVTISTNMAGRGTDIKLGPGVVDAGGLYVLGTERHEARRIDNQLRGRSGRQGDPGETRFFVSLRDELLAHFAGEWTIKVLGWLGLEEGMAIEDKRISKGIERAQKKVEERNFDIRKNLLEYDEVMDRQRKVFYSERNHILRAASLRSMVWNLVEQSVNEAVTTFLADDYCSRCVVEWAKRKMSVQIEPKKIQSMEADEVELELREAAKDEAVDNIRVTLGEYVFEGQDPKEWDLRGLSAWAMSRFGVNMSQNQLAKMDRMEIEEALIELANERIAQVDLSAATRLIDPALGASGLADWTRAKFDVDISADRLHGKGVEDSTSLIMEQVQQQYRQREITYPVEWALEMSFGEEEGPTPNAFALDALVKWANSKFNCNWSVGSLEGKSIRTLRDELLKLSAAYLGDGQLGREVDQALSNNGSINEWAKQRFELELEQGESDDTDQLRDQLLEGGRNFIRREFTELERVVMLQIFDAAWKDHLYAMDQLKSGIGLRGYAERDPKIEYKREGYRMFIAMRAGIAEKVSEMVFKARLSPSATMRSIWNIDTARHDQIGGFGGVGGEAAGSDDQQAAMAAQGERQKVATIRRNAAKVRPNDPCPCGSGKKYKRCHGKKG